MIHNFAFALSFALLSYTALTDCFSVSALPLYRIENRLDFGVIPEIDFHPTGTYFAATFLGNHRVNVYEMKDNKEPVLHQTLVNPDSEMSLPHGLVFHPKGKFLIVSHYGTHRLTVHTWDDTEKKLSVKPHTSFNFPKELNVHNSHGLAFSPRGDCLAITFCDCDQARGLKEKIVLFHFDKETGTIDPTPISTIQGEKARLGNPKGIVFSPNGKFLVTTMSDANTLVVYKINKKTYRARQKPWQLIANPEAAVDRPEDVKFSIDGAHIVVTSTNSSTVTIYGFDQATGLITPTHPIQILKNPESELSYPHGIGFSPDGKYMAISHFGLAEGGKRTTGSRNDKITIHTCIS